MLRVKYLVVIAVASVVLVGSGIAAAHGRHATDAAPKAARGSSKLADAVAPALAADSTDPAEAPEPTDATDSTGSSGESTHTQADCLTAAALDPSTDPTTVGLDAHGLQNALAHVLHNCIANPQAPGLLVALQHLSANLAKQAAQGAGPGNPFLAHGSSGEAHGNLGEAHGNSGS